MRDLLPLLVAALVLLPGCLEDGDPPEGGPGSTTTSATQPPARPGAGPPIVLASPADTWQVNETLSSVDCATVTMGLHGADAEWIRQQLPDGMTLPGTAPLVNVIVEECGSHALGNRSVWPKATLFLAYVYVDRDNGQGTESVAFPLEMSTNDLGVAAALQSWGIYSEDVSVSNPDGSQGQPLTVRGPTDDYEVTFGPGFPQRIQTPAFEARLWGDSDVSLNYRQTRDIEQFPLACAASFKAGRMANAFPQPVPCTFERASTSETILPEVIR